MSEFDLRRFMLAQKTIYDRAAEKLSGGKTRQWIWFTLPQIEGLGSSLIARQ